ncbi:MAG: PaaI family thioesterase [Lentisphaerae bacterium]|nr:PaaI family thioesterase [Lentisphaerota bacterium]
MAKPEPVPDGVLPWTRSCFVCGEENPHGLRLRSRHENGVVVLRYAPRPSDRGWRELVHGGIATTLLDEVMTWAAILHVRRACVAAELGVRLLRPIAVGQPLQIVGQITDGKPRLMRASGRIMNAAGQVLFEATGKFVPMRDDVAALCAEDFVEGPEAIRVDRIFHQSGA